MYKDFFGLEKLPFNLTPDPSFLFLPPKHSEALAGLMYSIQERKGFAVLTGDAGTGKTTLLSAVLGDFRPEQINSSVILNPTLTISEFLEIVLLDFGISDVPSSKAQRLWKLHTLLLEAHKEGKISVLVIDEAHKLSPELFEEIRLLGNFEYGTDKFLQILLLGQCELDALLNRHDLRQFKQRIAVRLYIDALSPGEVEEYIRFRWEKAGAKALPPFTAEAMNGIAEWSEGIPRLINSLCDTALLMAFSDGCLSVEVQHVTAAATNLSLPPVKPVDPPAVGTHDRGAMSRHADDLSPSKVVPLSIVAPPPSVQNRIYVPPVDPQADATQRSRFLRRLAERLRPSR